MGLGEIAWAIGRVKERWGAKLEAVTSEGEEIVKICDDQHEQLQEQEQQLEAAQARIAKLEAELDRLKAERPTALVETSA
jgi:chromosome segregation ATPase